MNDIDLAIKQWDPTKSNKKTNDVKMTSIFLQLYIEKLYGNDFHYLKNFSIINAFKNDYDDFKNLEDPIFLDRNLIVSFPLGKNSQELRKQISFNKNSPEAQKYIDLYKNTKKRFTLYEIVLAKLETGNGHIIYGIYDKKYNSIMFFDTTTKITKLIKYKGKLYNEFFKKIYGNEVNLDFTEYGCELSIFEHTFCKSESYKKLQGKGLCSVWVIWFLEVRLKNKDLTTEELIYKMKEELSKYIFRICDIIKGYSQFICDTTKDYYYVVENNKLLRISLKQTVKNKKQLKIGLIVSGLITLLSSFYLFSKRFSMKKI